MSVIVRRAESKGWENLKVELRPGEIVLQAKLHYFGDGRWVVDCVIQEATPPPPPSPSGRLAPEIPMAPHHKPNWIDRILEWIPPWGVWGG